MNTAVRNTIVAVATVASAIAMVGSAEAGHRHKHKHFKGHGHFKVFYGHKKHCFWTKKKVVHYGHYGKVIKFVPVKICR